MTNQEKKAYLNRYRLLDQQVQRTVDELTRWRSRAAKVTPSYSSEPTGGSQGDKIQTAVEQIIQLEEDANRQIDQLLTVKHEIETVIGTVPNDTERTILTYRYIDGLPWEEVAKKMGYYERHVRRLHGQALETINMAGNDRFICDIV